MSPRGAANASTSSVTTRSASAPYARRPAGQPKSSRQQFSACGACRMRRVRCDLKDLPIASAGPNTACSNCSERGLKCVDEFADVKAVKLLRRGRRLQQVEAIYGKVVDATSSRSPSSSSSPPAHRMPSTIPQLHPDFFSSAFWQSFCIQRPLLDPAEFPARLLAHTKGTHPLGHEGGLLAMLLVIWAASFGVDERGVPARDELDFDSTVSPDLSASPGSSQSVSDVTAKEASSDRRRRNRKDRVDAMIREVLELVDFHGVLRRPTWDGVRVLLLLLPLMEDAYPLERLALYQSAMTQAQSLCSADTSSAGPSSTINPASHSCDDQAIRTRIFWYAYIQEGISIAIRGGRLSLDNSDLADFQQTLPSYGSTINSGLSSPTSPTFRPSGDMGISTQHLMQQSLPRSVRGSPAGNALEVPLLFSTPLHLSNVCRKIHTVLTGPRATRMSDEDGFIDVPALREIWEDLDRCWEDLIAVRRESSVDLGIEQFVSGWLIFIFECHNIIRESLKQCASASRSQPTFSAPSPSSRPSSHSSSSSLDLPPYHLHAIAVRKCSSLLPSILRTMQAHIPGDHRVGGTGLFSWDSGLVRDGCFFAAFLTATSDSSSLDSMHGEEPGNSLTTEQGVALCAAALGDMRWAFSKSEGRQDAVRMAWQESKARRAGQYRTTNHLRRQDTDSGYRQASTSSDATYGRSAPIVSSQSSLHHGNVMTAEHTFLPPLVSHASRRSDSLPHSADGNGNNWTLSYTPYTPPGTGTSTTTSGTGLSVRGSPVFPTLAGPSGYKGEVDDSFYTGSGELDQFSYNAPIVGPMVGDPPSTASPTYQQRNSPSHSNPGATYLEAGVFTHNHTFAAHNSTDDIHSCPQFGDSCHGFYH